MKVILIEDDEAIRETFRECLELEGYGVEAFSNGKYALIRLHRQPEPCLILLDMMMPVMSGADFMASFSKFPATIVPVPVYLCSATASEAESRKIGCLGYIKKPVDLEVLLAIVRHYCDKGIKVA